MPLRAEIPIDVIAAVLAAFPFDQLAFGEHGVLNPSMPVVQ